jgi:hypothetical protein
MRTTARGRHAAVIAVAVGMLTAGCSGPMGGDARMSRDRMPADTPMSGDTMTSGDQATSGDMMSVDKTMGGDATTKGEVMMGKDGASMEPK